MVRMLERFRINCGSSDFLCFALLSWIISVNNFDEEHIRREEWMSKEGILFRVDDVDDDVDDVLLFDEWTKIPNNEMELSSAEWNGVETMKRSIDSSCTVLKKELKLKSTSIEFVCVCVCVCVPYVICQTPHHRVEICYQDLTALSLSLSLSLYFQICAFYFSIKIHNPKNCY